MNEKLTEAKPLEVLIVGCGNIAGGFYQPRNPDAFPILMQVPMPEIIDAK